MFRDRPYRQPEDPREMVLADGSDHARWPTRLWQIAAVRHLCVIHVLGDLCGKPARAVEILRGGGGSDQLPHEGSGRGAHGDSVAKVADLPEGFQLTVAGPDPRLTAELERALTVFNMSATGVTEEIGFSVQTRTAGGELVGGVTGWIWGYTSGMSMVWVADDHRSQGWATRLITAAEEEARTHGCRRMFVSSSTFQAPDLYRRIGYQEIARVPGLLADGVEDVWFVKQLD